MYKLCKTEQSACRQRELEHGLLQAMCTHRYEEISVSDLCDQLDIPRKSFYRYFSSKDGALHALIDHTLMEYEGYFPGYGKGNKRSYHKELEQFFQYWQDKHLLLDALDRSGLSGVLVLRAVDYAQSDLGIPIRFLPQNNKCARQHATVFGVCGLMSMVMNWHKTGFEMSVSQMADIAVELVTKPIFSEC